MVLWRWPGDGPADEDIEAGEVDADVELPGFDGRAIGPALAWALAREEGVEPLDIVGFTGSDGELEDGYLYLFYGDYDARWTVVLLSDEPCTEGACFAGYTVVLQVVVESTIGDRGDTASERFDLDWVFTVSASSAAWALPMSGWSPTWATSDDGLSTLFTATMTVLSGQYIHVDTSGLIAIYFRFTLETGSGDDIHISPGLGSIACETATCDSSDPDVCVEMAEDYGEATYGALVALFEAMLGDSSIMGLRSSWLWQTLLQVAAQARSAAELRYCSDDGSVEGDIDDPEEIDPSESEAG